MDKNQTYTTISSAETKSVAEKIAQTLSGGEVLLLSGDLGSGKTTFTQGLAQELGITRNITSPTFIIMRSYQVPHHKHITILYHLDLYRTENDNDLEGLGLSEILNKKDTITVIEWPEKMGTLLPQEHIRIHFSYIDEDKRKITVTS